jgi:hypothetical protein
VCASFVARPNVCLSFIMMRALVWVVGRRGECQVLPFFCVTRSFEFDRKPKSTPREGAQKNACGHLLAPVDLAVTCWW